MDARKERAKNDSRLYFIQFNANTSPIQFDVLGTTGKIYHIKFKSSSSKQWSCSCPDHTIRGATCKHIYFVIFKVLHLTENDDITADLIETIMNSAAASASAATASTTAAANASAASTTAAITNQDPSAECPICFYPLYDEKVISCSTCRNDLHHSCILKWRNAQSKSKSSSSSLSTSCPLCRGNILVILS
jgi:hypothetical protein